MTTPQLQQLLTVLRAAGVTHYNAPDLEVRFTLDAGQVLTKPAGELGELGELTEESDVEEGAEDGDPQESDADLLAEIRKANFTNGTRT